MCKVLEIPEEKRVNVFFRPNGISKVICFFSAEDENARRAAETWSQKLPASRKVEFVEVLNTHLVLSSAQIVRENAVLAIYWAKAPEVTVIKGRLPNGRSVCYSYYFSQLVAIGEDEEGFYFGGITGAGAKLIEKIMS